ncbi:Oidioi.mRNA.OKI2018_I69.XSR.g15663.t1.cds [Oikopleura dioica]|uniref:Oidioi.mRNA.OKI2018_I69.XSR.g15663.t1.cds n=1 Tax=Oikopleura dioica TaxID=34765 RepID=A0ABN7SHS7_OIKDI|nr:Oidioi.mRNA.OKI2018_I69.XSR.g15663.t1.cds [Oikopleura dioica]
MQNWVAKICLFILLPVFVLAQCPQQCICSGNSAVCRGIAWTEKPIFPENLKTLDLSNNRIGELDLAHLKGLETLILDGAALDELEKELALPAGLVRLSLRECKLSHVPLLGAASGTLRQLDLGKNRFREVTSLEFEHLEQLEELDLSENRIPRNRKQTSHRLHLPTSLKKLNLDGNQIRELSFGLFLKLENLEVLSMNNNSIAKVKGTVFANNKALQSLSLSGNKLKELPQFFLKQQSKLKHLDLSGNSLGESGMDLAIYIKGSRLESLNFSNNAISEITDDILYEQDQLISLDLSNNEISALPYDPLKGPWKYTRNLKILNVSSNKIQKLEANAFGKLSNLEELYLHDNKIETIFDHSFRGLDKLRILNLANNVISNELRNIANSIVNLPFITTIDLRQNALRRITRSTFASMGHIESIDLRANPLTEIDFEAFDERALRALMIDSEDFLCDCNLIWFSGMLKKIQSPSNDNNQCHYPPNLRGQNLLEVKHDQLTCDQNPKPVLIKGPMDANVEINEDVKFTCLVKTTEISSVEVEWIYQESSENESGDTRLTHKEGVIEINTPDVTKLVGNVVESSLTMKRLQRTRGAFPEGFIKCQVRNRYGSTVSNLAELTLFQHAHFLSTPRNQTVEVGDTVKLNCNAIGYPEPLVSWEFPRLPDEYKGRTQMSSDGRTVTIEHIQENDSGKYTCTAANSASKIAIDIYVRLAPSRELIEFNNDVEYNLGKDAVLKCHHPTIFPAVSTEWYFNNTLLHSSSRYQFVDDSSILVISHVDNNDQGFYQCKIFNELGQASSITKLHITGASIFQTAPFWLWIASVAVLAMLLTSLIWLGVFFATKSQRGQSDFGTESTNLPMPLERHLEDQQKSAKRLADNRAQGVVSWGSEYHQTPTPVMQTPSSQNSDICNTSYHQLQHPQAIPQHSPFYIPPPSPGPYAPPLGMGPVPRWAPRAATMPDLDSQYQNSPIHDRQLMPPPALPTPTFSYNPSITRSNNQLAFGWWSKVFGLQEFERPAQKKYSSEW